VKRTICGKSFLSVLGGWEPQSLGRLVGDLAGSRKLMQTEIEKVSLGDGALPRYHSAIRYR
jgi:hypothetical protein